MIHVGGQPDEGCPPTLVREKSRVTLVTASYTT
jgi:hypothetical protein